MSIHYPAKGTVIPVHVMREYGGLTPLIRNLGGQLHASPALQPRKERLAASE